VLGIGKLHAAGFWSLPQRPACFSPRPAVDLAPAGLKIGLEVPSPPCSLRNNRLESGAWKRLDSSPGLAGARRQISPALSKGGLLGLDEPEARSFSPRLTDYPDAA
jgi:hypothetical protein